MQVRCITHSEFSYESTCEFAKFIIKLLLISTTKTFIPPATNLSHEDVHYFALLRKLLRQPLVWLYTHTAKFLITKGPCVMQVLRKFRSCSVHVAPLETARIFNVG